MSSVAMAPFNNAMKERVLTSKDVQELAGRSPNMDGQIRPTNMMTDMDNEQAAQVDKFGHGHKELHNNEKSQEPLNRD